MKLNQSWKFRKLLCNREQLAARPGLTNCVKINKTQISPPNCGRQGSNSHQRLMVPAVMLCWYRAATAASNLADWNSQVLSETVENWMATSAALVGVVVRRACRVMGKIVEETCQWLQVFSTISSTCYGRKRKWNVAGLWLYGKTATALASSGPRGHSSGILLQRFIFISFI